MKLMNKRIISLLLALVMLCGMMPMTVFAVEDDSDAVTDEVTNTSKTLDVDLFIFAGQSNMMGASVLEPEVDTFTDKSFEYKYVPRLRGEATGSFVPAQNPAGEFYYNDLTTAYGDMINDLSYKSTLSNYSANTYFCPAMRDGVKSFSAQSEADTYPAASLAPYFVTEYAEYGHASVYAHMAKGSAKIVHYFTPEMVTCYNTLITEYNNENGKSYSTLSVDSLSGAGDAFDKKYNAMVEDYATFAPDKTVKNKCFVWLQGESDGSNYIEYKLKLQVLWEHLQELGFTHFFVLRVGYWGNTGILNVIKAQEDFCAENDNCYIITRAPSLIPHATATTDNWWIDEPSAEYDNCRDSYLVNSNNNHFNEKAMQIFAERSAANVHRILHQGLEPVLEAENIQGMVAATPEVDMPEDTTPYTSYVGTEVFHNGLSVSNKSNVWKECTSSTAASTDLIPVNSADSVWLQYVFFLSEAHAVGGFYDIEGNLVAPLYYKDFGFSLGGGGGEAAFRTPEITNRVSIAAIEAATGKEIAFVRFTAWQASAGGHANTEARIYHSYSTVVTAPTCTEQGYTTYTCECGESYVDDYVDATGHSYENGICTGCGVNEWDTDGDGVLEILAIGNSFSVDALQYAYQIARNLGIEEIAIGNLYIGGCTLATHAANAAGDLGKYTYYFNDNGTWTSTGSYKISTALESRSWDYVSLQQGSPVSGVESSYNEDLTNLIAYVQERSDAKLVWHMTWAYQQNSTHSAFPTYGSNQMTMYNAIVSAVQNKIVTNENFDLLVPNGTAVQNSRTSLLGDTTTRDGYHMSYDYGRYLTGLLFIKTVTGLSIDNITYAPSGVDAEEKAIAIEAANNAFEKPFEVTQSTYIEEEPVIPDEGYILLQPELYQGAYWNPTNSTSYNTIITTASNSSKYFATIRFTWETLPVGSIIILEDGWQYRPDGWITDAVQSSRADTTTESYVLVTEEWWGDYTIRSFNISKVGLPSLANVTEEEVRAAFRIYVPEAAHAHRNSAVVTAPTCTEAGYTTYTCTLCGDSYVDDYVEATGEHSYENGICAGCGEATEDAIWTTVYNGQVTGAFASLQEAVNFCGDGDTIVLTENCVANSGASIDKNITIDGGNHLVDISGCVNAFITVAEGVEVTLQNLGLDGGASGFQVDYDAVTYTNYTIPLVSGSLDNDPKAGQSAIISSGDLVCENVDISNRYTASVGGAMQILAGSVRLTDCDFVHNYGTSKGGALYIGSNFGTRTEYPVEQVTITGCTFTENYTGHGGAIYAYNVETIEITNSEFLNNTANGGKGGAIDLFSETTKPTTAMGLGLDFIQTTIRDCSFRGNWAGNDGFAIQSYDSDLYVYNSEFIENVGVHPTSSVGTISTEAYRHADESYRIYTLLDGCLFESNEGPCAVYGDHSSIADLDVTGCVFKNNRGNDSFLLYSATSHITDCQFIGETMEKGVIDARIYENYTVPPLLILTDVTFTDCDTPAEILTRKQNHNLELNTYQVILEGTTNGDITIWDGNAVTIHGTHTGNIQFGYDSERACLTVGSNGTVNGIMFTQPFNGEAKLGERYMVEVLAEGEGLTYQWYGRNAGSKSWFKSSVKDNTYDDVMTTARAGREVYCVITDKYGNSVTTDIVKLICIPSEKLEIVTQPTDGEAVLGERFCVTVEAKGEGLKYQWYFRNAGTETWYKSSVRDNTYDDVMTKARDGREVYCVITDLAGNKVTTDIVKLVRVPMKLEITSQPTDAEAAFGEMFCATVEAKGEGLKYQWYYRNAGSSVWHKSGVRDNTYDDVMTKARNGREIYCVITDRWGNSVTTDTVKLIAVPKVELKLLGVSYESAAMGERFCVTVNAQGEGLTYTWYFRNAGATRWSKSGVTDNTYDDVMNKTRANREVYCVITDACGNQIITEVITLTVEK